MAVVTKARMPRFLHILLVGVSTSIIEMRSHIVRSVLSIFGVTLGVAALVAMLSLIGGIEVYLRDTMGAWAGSIWVWGDDSPEKTTIAASRSPGLRFSDAAYLSDSTRAIAVAFEEIGRRGDISIGGVHQHRARLRGISRATWEHSFTEVQLKQGRLLNERDYETGKLICIISSDLAERVQTGLRRQGKRKQDLLGEFVTYNRIKLEIVGIVGPEDPEYHSWYLRRMVALPLKTMQQYISGFDPYPGNLHIQVQDPELLEQQAQTMSAALQARHRGVKDFEYRGAEWVEETTEMFSNVSLVIGLISIVSLLVGGMGIMNVMLSSISERVREIGIRKAFGARSSHIALQFMAETTTLSVIGGIFGSLLGSLPLMFSEAIKKSTEGTIEPTILPVHILAIAAVIIGVGVVFGMYPAWRAARLDPIEALHYE